ncbi:MAG: glycosyl hydrolase, partial [Bacteroides sp.]|nr:glycosyl hydrolase [Bacteroides sp.]
MKTFNILSIGLLLSLVSCTQVPGGKGDSAIEQKIEALLSKMTLEEKLGQMNQISSYGNIEDMSGLIKKGEVGSILNEVDPVRVNALQRVAVEESRLGIPVLMARDVIHGFKTIFPIPLGQAASFNPQVAEEGARVAAIEASAAGIRWTFAPMIDVARDPRWGRIAEGCGEDTYLTSVMGTAMVKGFQSDSLSDPTAVAACPKHFVGYGAAEGGRDYNSTFIPERRLRNVYLPPFEAAAKAGAATFMTSFNDNDGVPSTGNTFILKDVLRKEWGFDGLVVTDWASASEMMSHGFAADPKEVAMKAVNAGVDMEMVSYTFVRELPALLKEGKVKEAAIDEAVRNILRIKFRLGLFDNPYVDEKRMEVLYAPSHLEAAKRAAVESAILLKNAEGILPLSASVKS